MPRVNGRCSAHFQHLLLDVPAGGVGLGDCAVLRVGHQQAADRHVGGVAGLARERRGRQVVAERVRHRRVQRRLLLVAEGRVGHVEVDVVGHARAPVEEVAGVGDDARPDLLLERDGEAIVQLRPQLELVEADRAAQAGVAAVGLPVGLDHGVDGRRERIGQDLARPAVDQAERRRGLREAGVLVDEVAERVADVAGRHQETGVGRAHHRGLAEAVVQPDPRHEVPRRDVPHAAVLGSGEDPLAVVRIRVALARHELLGLCRHRRRRRGHLGDRLGQVEPL